MKHSLTNKDKVELVADCSACEARVPIRYAGRGFVCLEARREARRRYRQNHPEQSKRQKAAANPSTHRLELRNGEPDTCVVCGPVQPVRWGRGWMCPTIPKEKGWNVTEMTNVRPRRLEAGLRDEIHAAGLHVETGSSPLPTETENAVNGWVTLGPPATKPGTAHYSDPWQGRQVYIKPEYALCYGAGAGYEPASAK